MTFFRRDDQLQQWGESLLHSTWERFPSLRETHISLTWIVYDPPVIVNTGGAISPEDFWKYPVRGFGYRSLEQIYPASVVKLFYLVAVYEWLENGMLKTSAELERAVRDMIVDSSNDATSLVLDLLTGTTSGPELPPAPFETWKFQRNIVNRYFQALGWQSLGGININQKTWGDGPYGRERTFVGESGNNRNRLTADAIAHLFHSIVGGVAVSRERSQTMMDLLHRSLCPQDWSTSEEDNQITGFLGAGLPTTAKLWSKAGWTSQVRHDAAYIELPDCSPYLLVVLTEGSDNSSNQEILPFISQQIVKLMVER